jgi:hypothetical protein
MESNYFDSFTLIVIFGGFVVVLVGLALRQVESMQKNIPIWLFTGLMGILIGGGVTMVAMHTCILTSASNERHQYKMRHLHTMDTSNNASHPIGLNITDDMLAYANRDPGIHERIAQPETNHEFTFSRHSLRE